MSKASHTNVAPTLNQANTGSPDRNPLTLQIGMYWSTAEHSGGLDRVYTDLVLQLPAVGIETIGAVEGPATVETRSHGRTRAFGASDAGKLSRYRQLRRNLGAILESGDEFDLVVVHFALYGRLILDRLRSPLVVHFQGPWAQEALAEGALRPLAWVRHVIEASVYRKAARIIVLSQAFSDLLQRDYAVPEAKIRIVPGHVDVERFRCVVSRRSARVALDLPEDRPLMVAVRRLKRRMGLGTLLDALSKIVTRHPNVLLALGGTGPLRDELEAKVQALGLAKNVRFLGYVTNDNLPLLFRAADFSIIPTESLEGFGLVAAESLAAGTPAIVTPVGGLPEVVAGLSRDLVFAASTAGAMASHLECVLSGSIVLPGMAACEAYAAENFALTIASSRVATVYRELLHGR